MMKLSRSLFVFSGLLIALTAGASFAHAGWERDFEGERREAAAKTFEDGYRDGFNKANLLPRLQACGDLYQAAAWGIAMDIFTHSEAMNEAYSRGFSAGITEGKRALESAPSLCPTAEPQTAPKPKKKEKRRVRGFGSARWD